MTEFTIKQDPTGPDRPQDEPAGPALPEKFANAEDPQKALLEAYLELERNRGAGGQKAEEETPEETPEGGSEEETNEETPEEDGDELPPPEGLPKEMAPFTAEFSEKGELSDESYEKLTEMGYSRDVVDTYIDAMRPLSQEDEAAVIESAGGSEAFEELAAWGAENLSEEDMARYNRLVVRKSTSDMAVAWLRSKMESETGRPPARRVTGRGSPSAGSVKGYSSMAEMRRDMKSAKYKTDAAFRAQVDKRLAATTAF